MNNMRNTGNADTVQGLQKQVTQAVADSMVAFAIGYGVATAVGYVTGYKTPTWVAVASGAGVSAAISWHRDHFPDN